MKFCIDETASELYRRLKCTPFTFNFEGMINEIQFGEFVEMFGVSIDKERIAYSMISQFVTTHTNSYVLIISNGCLRFHSQETSGLWDSVKYITPGSINEFFYILQLILETIDNSSILIVCDGLTSLYRSEDNMMDGGASALYLQCLHILHRLCTHHWVITVWLSTYAGEETSGTISSAKLVKQSSSPSSLYNLNGSSTSSSSTSIFWKQIVKKTIVINA